MTAASSRPHHDGTARQSSTITVRPQHQLLLLQPPPARHVHDDKSPSVGTAALALIYSTLRRRPHTSATTSTVQSATQVATVDDVTPHAASSPVFSLSEPSCVRIHVCHTAVKRNIYNARLLQPTRGIASTAAAAAAAAGVLSLPASQQYSSRYKLQCARTPGSTANMHRHRRFNRFRD